MIAVSDLSPATITLVSGAIVTIIGALFAGFTTIITTLRDTRVKVTSVEANAVATRVVVAADAEASQTRDHVRDRKIQEIHILVNSRLLTVLHMLVTLTKKEAERTHLNEDIKAYEEALADLQRAEASSGVMKTIDSVIGEANEAQAVVADKKLTTLISALAETKRVEDVNKHLLSLDGINNQ
jgi:hypothetical protein